MGFLSTHTGLHMWGNRELLTVNHAEAWHAPRVLTSSPSHSSACSWESPSWSPPWGLGPGPGVHRRPQLFPPGLAHRSSGRLLPRPPLPHHPDAPHPSSAVGSRKSEASCPLPWSPSPAQAWHEETMLPNTASPAVEEQSPVRHSAAALDPGEDFSPFLPGPHPQLQCFLALTQPPLAPHPTPTWCGAPDLEGRPAHSRPGKHPARCQSPAATEALLSIRCVRWVVMAGALGAQEELPHASWGLCLSRSPSDSPELQRLWLSHPTALQLGSTGHTHHVDIFVRLKYWIIFKLEK